MNTLKVLLALMLVAVGVAYGADTPAADAAKLPPNLVIPDLPSGRVEMSWADVQALLKQIQPPEPVEERPPVDWALTAVAYDARALNNNSLEVTARMSLAVWKPEGWVLAPVLGEGLPLTSAKLDGKAVSLTRLEQGAYGVVLNQPGEHTLEASFCVAAAEKDGVVSFSFPCMPTPVAVMHLSVPEPGATVLSPQAAQIKLQEGEQGVEADLVFRATDKVEVSWTLPAVIQKQEADRAKPKPVVEPRVACSSAVLATVADRYVSCAALVRYDVLRGAVDAFRLHLPPGVNVLDVQGTGMAWSQADVEDGQQIDVKLNHSVDQHYALQLRYEAPISEDAAAITIPELQVEQVARTTGYIGVTVQGALEVAPAEETAALTRVDTTELPVDILQLATTPILLGYKHNEPDYLLAVNVKRLRDVPVRVASIDLANVSTVVTEDGLAITKAVYHVRNNVKQFLRLELEKGAEVWAAEVAGRPVKPSRDTDSDAVLLPLCKSIEANQRVGWFPVQIIFATEGHKLGGILSGVTLAAPKTDILTSEMVWQVSLPNSRLLYRAEGDLKAVDTALMRQPQYAASSLHMAAQRSRNETLYPLRQEDARFFLAQDQKGAATAPESEVSTAEQAPGADIAVAGVLPIRLELPTEGVAKVFRRTVLTQGSGATLELHTVDRRVRTLGWWTLLTFAAVLGAALVRWVGNRLAERRSILALCGAVLVCLLAGLIWGGLFWAAGFGGVVGLALSQTVRRRLIAAVPAQNMPVPGAEQ